MQYVKFGSTGMDVSRICLGMMSFGRPGKENGVRHIEEAVSALDITLDPEEIATLEAPYVPHIKTGAF